MMSSDDPFIRLQDFVAWVRKRRPIQQDAWVDEQTLEFVTLGIERFLEGKEPWLKPKISKPRGRKPKPDVMWQCYRLATFADENTPHLPQHKQQGGAYAIVGELLNLSADNVETHVRKARALLDTAEGKRDFLRWLNENEYGPKGLKAILFDPSDPRGEVERKRRDAAGVGNRYPKAELARRKVAVMSGKADPKQAK